MAPTAQAKISNMALARVGITEFIEDLADNSEEADVCEVFFDQLRDACLAAFPWPFATLRSTLVVKADETARDGWTAVYALPTNLLIPRKIWPAGINIALFNSFPFLPGQIPTILMSPRAPRADQKIPFAIEKSSTDDSKVLLTDVPTPVLFYTAQITDTTKLDAPFIEAFAWYLASEIAVPLTKDVKKAEYALKMYERKILEAWAIAINSNQEDQVPDSEMIVSRL